ncbi:3-deoxy-D-manno-octulosonate 8-phosphate phosphatase KdsC [Botrimarina colliarenosi]|uniref:3-deoxy-D-manno-octulosonate 8-phosphate phosphatase KdsC n=1 Tax=Botrimarina colliarenosi TaxID=2528001 RepID=A0A5C6AKM0_9BACT|nr:HAD hydrolase family protein [Botrimarina colliarenosi]TWT99808.1 3-deoxy-D-manno-octulosonate 8-phosphate phosphatase KdsC [Botrimarina colliarenosi]
MPEIQLLLTDVDGVLTDGGMTFDEEGRETKTFNVHDGLGVKLWQRAGGKVGIVTGRTSRVVEKRATELAITIVHQGVAEKLAIVRQIADEEGLALDQIAYIGDDLPDLATVEAVGFGAAVADAAADLKAAADYVTLAPGGRGALREIVDKLLKESGRWDAATGSLHG